MEPGYASIPSNYVYSVREYPVTRDPRVSICEYTPVCFPLHKQQQPNRVIRASDHDGTATTNKETNKELSIRCDAVFLFQVALLRGFWDSKEKESRIVEGRGNKQTASTPFRDR